MSANNQILVKEHKGKFYVFDNVMAESWGDEEGNHKNELHLKRAKGIFDNRDDAYEFGLDLEKKSYEEDGIPTEYGVQFNRLCKDDAEVILIE